MEQTYFQAGQRRTYQEMRQKPAPRDTFFSLKSEPQTFLRPSSVTTEFVDTDFDDDTVSETGNNSPRVSLQSSGQPSFTTLSTYDEVPTPRSSRQAFIGRSPKEIEGPRGPHLFRGSQSINSEELTLSLSPVTPKVPRGIPDFKPHTQLPTHNRHTPFEYTREELDTSNLVSWTPEMVAQSMFNAGIELNVADRFVENDINGPILITLKFEDLRELDIPSFGIRTKVWHQIQALRDSRPASPRPSTPIEDAPSREARKEARSRTRSRAKSHGEQELKRRPSSSKKRSKKKQLPTDTITPGESVSIIGIEQILPKPHVCSKGENCSKWRKQARLIEQFKKENPHVDVSAGGRIMIMGDAGNPETAKAIDPNEAPRPMSDAVPSVVASSDVLGTGGLPPLQYLQEASLRTVQSRDPQDNVRQFLQFQRNNPNEVPPTPPFEVTTTASPHHGLRRLPRLSIPVTSTQQPNRPIPPRASTAPPQQEPHQQEQQMVQQQQIVQSPQQDFVPYMMEKADPISPDLETPRNPYRFGTPFSEMDVPVTAVPIGPVSRDASQSVPPDMNYHHVVNNSTAVPRTQSRASRRPSFPVLPAVDENRAVRLASQNTSPNVVSPPKASVRSPHQPLHAPPRVQYPWSPVEPTNFETAIPPVSTVDAADDSAASTITVDGVTFQGPMKKRKTKILRHEWQDGYFTLKGTRLNMHKDAAAIGRTLEYIDIDDYAIACSSVASSSKLAAAFKAVSISHDRKKSDPVGAFQFQLIPQDKNGARLRKRESSISGNATTSTEGVNGTGKTHHFAVKSRDDRIDWMRELMLAKALRQKGDGFEINVNGSMI
jgi:hypothetical protein